MILPRAGEGLPGGAPAPRGRGRYPDFDVLEHWDEATHRAVLGRVGKYPPIRFFDEGEAATLGAF